MEAVVVHSGFDGLKFTIQTDISPELREKLASAKTYAKETFSDCVIDFGLVSLSVTNKGARGFTTHTGDHGAVWLFQAPEDPIPNNPDITVDFRAFGLAVTGIDGAEAHFRECLILPPGTKSTEYADIDKTETVSSGSRVVGLRAGAIANRQLAIYDKRAEVIQTGKMG